MFTPNFEPSTISNFIEIVFLQIFFFISRSWLLKRTLLMAVSEVNGENTTLIHKKKKVSLN